MDREIKVKYSNKELVEKCNSLIRELAQSGGKSWTLQVPVNFEKDPDVLFSELGKRLLESENRWISVEERLPDDDENVFAYSTHPSEENNRVEVVFYNTSSEEWDGVNSMFLNKITHWQPLPPKP